MEFDAEIQNWKDAVISFEDNKLFKTEQIKKVIKDCLEDESYIPRRFYEGIKDRGLNLIATRDGKHHNKVWFEEGINCEILKANSHGWQKGKMKINVTLEFLPDEPENLQAKDDIESELDDIRQQINRNSY